MTSERSNLLLPAESFINVRNYGELSDFSREACIATLGFFYLKDGPVPFPGFPGEIAQGSYEAANIR